MHDQGRRINTETEVPTPTDPNSTKTGDRNHCDSGERSNIEEAFHPCLSGAKMEVLVVVSVDEKGSKGAGMQFGS